MQSKVLLGYQQAACASQAQLPVLQALLEGWLFEHHDLSG
jgi:hypothetical protein